LISQLSHQMGHEMYGFSSPPGASLAAATGERKAEGRPRDSRYRAMAGSLFDRLLVDDEDEDVFSSHAQEPIEGIIRSIKRNLHRVLNMHAGGAAANPGLGLADMNHSTVNSKEVSEHIVASIRHCILSSEPRITKADIACINDPDTPLTLQFAITCYIKAASIKEQIRIDLAMRDGHFYHID